MMIVFTACQPESDSASTLEESTMESAPAEPVTGGIIVSGDLQGNEFSIATGEVVDNFLAMVEAFNNMDAEAVWAYSADTISMYSADGSVVPMTKADMAGFYSSADSLEWRMEYVLPVHVEGTNLVKIIANSRETVYAKDGSVMDIKLLEEFTFDDGTLVEVRQWTAEL